MRRCFAYRYTCAPQLIAHWVAATLRVRVIPTNALIPKERKWRVCKLPLQDDERPKKLSDRVRNSQVDGASGQFSVANCGLVTPIAR